MIGYARVSTLEQSTGVQIKCCTLRENGLHLMFSGIVTMQKISSLLACIEPNNPIKREKALARLSLIRAKKSAVYVDAVDALENDFGSFFESLSCSPPGENDAPRSVTVPGVFGPGASTLSGRRDCNGIPLSVGDTVAFLDTEPLVIVGFANDITSTVPRFVYALRSSPVLELRTFPCGAVTFVKSSV